MNVMTVKEAAEKWGVTSRYVQQLIRDGRIGGVIKLGTTQVIPLDTRKPPRKKHERRKPKE